MSNSEVQNLLNKLKDELQNTRLDDETRNLVSQLDTDIHDLLNPDSPQSDSAGVVERARLLESGFATKHPAAERFVREVIDTLVRMGV